MRFLEKEISNKRDLKVNIPRFCINLSNVYGKYSYVKLTMNYFTYYEMVGESNEKDEKVLALTGRFNEQILKVLSDTVSVEAVEEVEAIRSEIMDIMTELTACVDACNLFEYCLNRIEYRFKDGTEFLQISNEQITKDVLQYIVSDQDNVVINSKICEVIRQLPIRMTKARFFELLKEGMKVYKDSEKGSVDDFVYMIKTVSMLDQSENGMQLSAEVKEIYHDFLNIDFSQVKEETYQSLRDKLTYAIDQIQSQVDTYMMLAELVNDLYVICLTDKRYQAAVMPTYSELLEEYHSELVDDDKDRKNCLRMIDSICKLFHDAEYTDVCEELEDGFFALEGRQEKYGMMFQKFGYLMDTIVSDHEEVLKELELVQLKEIFAKIAKLVSGSLFAPFEEDAGKQDIAGIDYIMKQNAALEASFSAFFEKKGKLMKRAVMAHALSELPVFFNNLEELKQYIISAFEHCGDEAEKIAVIEILSTMIHDEM